MTLDPENGTHLTFVQNTLCYLADTAVPLAAPVTAVALAASPARKGSRSGRVALGVAIALVVGALALMIPSLISW